MGYDRNEFLEIVLIFMMIINLIPIISDSLFAFF